MSKLQNLPKGMLEELNALKQTLVSAQLDLEGETAVGSAGGGAVQVTLSGDQKCIQVHVSPELLTNGDVEMLQGMLQLAINNAIETSRDLLASRLKPISGDPSAE